MIKVSIIVPVYNAEQYIEKCLDSLLGQTLQEIEIIAVDDGSADTSPGILKRYAEKSNKVKVFTKKNGGVSDARNYGLRHAQGEYIGFLDSDDFADPEMYEAMYETAFLQGGDIVECNLHHNYADYEDTEIVDKYYTPGELLCFGRYVVWNKIYRRSWLLDAGVLFPAERICEDLSFISKLIPYIGSYSYIDAAPVHYVQRGESLNNSKSEITMDVFGVLKGIVDFYRNKGFYDEYRQELEYLYARILLCSSFKRMCRIPDGNLRRKALRLNYMELTDTFPGWRSNKVLKAEKSRNAFFMKLQRPLIYRCSCAVFPKLLGLKNRFGSGRY